MFRIRRWFSYWAMVLGQGCPTFCQEGHMRWDEHLRGPGVSKKCTHSGPQQAPQERKRRSWVATLYTHIQLHIYICNVYGRNTTPFSLLWSVPRARVSTFWSVPQAEVSTFFWDTWPLRSGQNFFAGRIWPTGRTLNMPVLGCTFC